MAESLPRLREDLRIIPHSEGNQDSYIIEDPLRNVFFKIGLREYRFLCRLHHIHTQADLCPQSTSEHDLSEEESLSILRWLAAKQLLQNQQPEVMRAIESMEERAKKKGRLNRLNLITFRIPFFNPDPLLDRHLAWTSWLAGPLFLGLWLICGIIAMAVLLTNWSQFISESAGFFSPLNVLLVSVIWVLLKLLHELSHALACKRYGGGVYDFGVLFILFIPLTYVNASTSWSFATKWQRLHVAVAGIYIELFVAWLAIIYWATHIGTPGALIAHNTVIVAGISSLIFNANPLMRFDGYFVLSDLTSTPNLYFRGLDAVRKAAAKWWLGIEDTSQEHTHNIYIKLYGIGIFCWRFLILFSLGFAASKMLSGWGLLVTIGAAAGWLYQPVANFFAKIPDYRGQNPKFLSHLLTRISLVIVIGGCAIFGISWHKTITIPAVVLFEKQHVIRAEASGFIEELFVRPGDSVHNDDTLLLLVNDELATNKKVLELDLTEVDLQKRAVHAQGRYGELQILEGRREVIVAKLENVQEDDKALLLRSPGDGKVVGKAIGNRLGTMVRKGEELFLVVNPEHKHLVASVAQNDIAAIKEQLNGEVLVDMTGAGLGTFTGRIQKIIPTASTDLIHFSFAAPYGGPFDVRPGPKNTYQLYSPRFAVHISIPENVRHTLRDGQQAEIRLNGINRSVASLLWQNGKAWFLGRQGMKYTGQ